MTSRIEDIRRPAADDLRKHQVVVDGHFDYGNGFHGPRYLNPHHDDVRNTGQTSKRCLELIDRREVAVVLPVANLALVEYGAPPNVPAADCELCRAGVPVTRF